MNATAKPPRRALIVIDVQNEYVDGNLPIEYPPMSLTLPNVLRAMDAAAEAGIPIAVVQHTSPAGAPVFDRDTRGWQLHPDVAARPRQLRLEKNKPSVFSSARFADWILEYDINTLTIAGYMTHNCNAATAYEAMHRGLSVEFLSDATGALPYANAAGSASAEEIHRVFSVVFHTNFAAVTSTRDWIAALQEGRAIPRDNVFASNRRAREAAAA